MSRDAISLPQQFSMSPFPFLDAPVDLCRITFEQYRKPTRHEQFLGEMNCVVPWTDIVAMSEPVPGSPPTPLVSSPATHIQ